MVEWFILTKIFSLCGSMRYQFITSCYDLLSLLSKILPHDTPPLHRVLHHHCMQCCSDAKAKLQHHFSRPTGAVPGAPPALYAAPHQR